MINIVSKHICTRVCVGMMHIHTLLVVFITCLYVVKLVIINNSNIINNDHRDMLYVYTHFHSSSLSLSLSLSLLLYFLF